MALTLGSLNVNIGADTSGLSSAGTQVNAIADRMVAEFREVRDAIRMSTSSMQAMTSLSIASNDRVAASVDRVGVQIQQNTTAVTVAATAAVSANNQVAQSVDNVGDEMEQNEAISRRSSTNTRSQNTAVGNSFKKLGGIIATYMTVSAAKNIIIMADSMHVLERRLIRFTGDAESAADAMGEMVVTASQVGTKVGDVVSVFQRFSLIRDEIGASNDEILEMTDTLSKMGSMGGSTGEELSRALVQLSQSFSGGILRAQEYNSIVEQAPEIIKRMGKEMDLTMGEFRRDMLDGKITSDRMFDAIQASAEDVSKEFSEMPVSIMQATQAVKNTLGVAIANLDKNMGFTESLSKTLRQMSVLIQAENTLYARKEKLADQQRKINEEIDKGDEEQKKKAKELNDILDQRKVLLEKFKVSNEAGWMPFSKAKDDAKEYRKQIDELNKKIQVMVKESEALKNLSKNASGILIDGVGAGGDDDKPKTVPLGEMSEKDQGTLEKLRQLGETEREEIARIAEERRAFVAEQTQLGQEEKNKLLENINEEERAKIAELAESHLEQIRQLNETEIEEIERLAQEKREFVLAQDQLEADERANLLTEIEENRLAKLQDQADKEVEIAKRAAADKKAADEKSFNDRISGLTTANEAMSALNQTALGENKELAAIQAGISMAISMAKASEIGFPQNIPLIAGAAAQGMQIKSLLAGSGRVNGGQTSHQLATPINEAGVPEIYQEGSRQYLMPTGGSGKVIPLDGADSGISGGSMPNISIYNSGVPATIESTQITRDEIKIMISQSEKRINTSLATGRGDSANAVKKGFKLERNLNA